MENYQPNSNLYKTEQKEKEKRVKKPVVTGKVITKKKSGLRKFTDEFISDDARNVKSYIFGDVIIPTIKKTLLDIVTIGFEMMLYGESRGGRKRSTVDKVSYTKYSDRDYAEPRSRREEVYDYDEVYLTTRGEAEDVLDAMSDIINEYENISIGDFKELVGIRTINYMDNKYGWTSMRGMDVVHTRDGYWIKLPKATPIK